MQVADFVLARLTEWGVHRIYGYPGDGINGMLGAFHRPVICFEGDGAFQMNGLAEMITIKRYLDRLGGSPPFIFCVFNNQDLNQVTWEQRAMAGDPKFPGSQNIPDVPHHKYAELLGIYCDDPGQVGKAWDEALASDVPVILEFKTDPEVPPLPPHIMKEQAKKSAKAALHDPERMGLAVHRFRRKMVEYYESSPAGTSSRK